MRRQAWSRNKGLPALWAAPRARIFDARHKSSYPLSFRSPTSHVDLLIRTGRATSAGVWPATADRMPASTAGEGPDVALKAHGVDKSAFATIFILSRKGRDLDLVSSPVPASAGCPDDTVF